MKAIEPIWSDKTETANRLRGRIETVLNWATTHNLRTGDNPARWRGHLENLLPRRSKVAAVKHFAAMPYDKMAAFMIELQKQDGAAALALQFTILTAVRTEQTLGATWDEFDLKGRHWIIPGKRMKAGKDHRVPLSDEATKILDCIAAVKQGKYVFQSNRSDRLSGMAMLMLLRRMGHNGLTVHGFRSSFRDWAAERTNYPSEIAEMALAHVVGDKVEAAYRRGDLLEKRRHMMTAWAEFCTTVYPTATVIPLHA
ncbi:MAG: site-specific integrase [Pseudolabrys sp.]